MGWAKQRRPRPLLMHAQMGEYEVLKRCSLASCVIVSGFRAALDLDTYPLSNFIRPRCAERAKPSRGKPVLIMHIGFFTCFHAISLERSRFSEFSCPCSTEAVGIAYKPPRSLCSARIVADKQTDRQTHRTTTVSLARRACTLM